MNQITLLTLFLALFGYTLSATCIVPVIGGGTCENNYDCGGPKAGQCLNGTCNCTYGYYQDKCQYKAKEALTAGLLGLTLLANIPGIPSLYVGNLQWGIPQIVIGILALPAAIALGITVSPFFKLLHLAWTACLIWTLNDSIQYGIQNPGYQCDGAGYLMIYQHAN